MKPFLIPSSSWFRTAGPLDLGTPEYAAEYNEVKALGSADPVTTTRTVEQTYRARWWQSTPNGLWNAVARDLVARNGFGLLDSARLFAMQNLSAADAAINCWNDKYFYDFWRPVNAIRCWTTATRQPSPTQRGPPSSTRRIPTIHRGISASTARTPGATDVFWRRDRGGIPDHDRVHPHPSHDAATRSFGSFSEAIAELIEARIWAGLHFRTADVQG